MLKSFWRYKFFWLVFAVIAVILVFKLFKRREPTTGVGRGPAYDLIFAVNTFDPYLESPVYISPYVIDGVMYVECNKLAANEGTSSTWISFYRYHNKTGTVEQLPSPKPNELKNITKKETYVFSATKGIKLYAEEQSPDGYKLAEPGWVTVNPVSNLLGNIMLFFLAGGFEDIKEREETPRFTKGDISLSLKSENALFKNEADSAFPLGWVVPDGTGKGRK